MVPVFSRLRGLMNAVRKLETVNLKARIVPLRWSVWRLAVGNRNITTTGQIGDGSEAAAVD